MIVIGEKINATRKRIAAALEQRDEELIVTTAVEQADAGADYLDVNGGNPRQGRESENIAWLVRLVQVNTDCPVSVDTADVDAARKGLSLAEKKPILNSISLEHDRLESFLPLLGEFDCRVIALLMDDAGTPAGVDDRVDRAGKLIERLTNAGREPDDIIVDPCFLPVSTDTASAARCMEAITAIRQKWPDVHVGGGVSNISFGLPKRRTVNLAALGQAIYCGMDAVIADPCTADLMPMILAAEALAGRDEFCMNYVQAMR
ncbi:MAG: dihydropteroate synthase [Planctomycetota bacterium]